MGVNSASAIASPVIDLRTGYLTRQWQQVFLSWSQQLNGGFDQNGNLIGNLGPNVQISGRQGTVTTITQNISAQGVVAPSGMTSATATAQGAVILPDGAASNKLGSAALSASTSFDVAGAAAQAQTASQSYADAADTVVLNNANAFARNASNITEGTLDNARLNGFTGTITTAKLTNLGANGSMTFENGLLISEVPAT